MAKLLLCFLLAVAAVPAAFTPATSSPQPPPLLTPLAPLVDCLQSLGPVLPCVSYLTESSVRAPTAGCCGGLRSVLDSSSRICLCHVLNPEINNQTGANTPISLTRALLLPLSCGIIPPLEVTYMCFTETIPPLVRPRAPPAAPRTATAATRAPPTLPENHRYGAATTPRKLG
ncbi:unnamed protein product [Urochloa humidicola]